MIYVSIMYYDGNSSRYRHIEVELNKPLLYNKK